MFAERWRFGDKFQSLNHDILKRHAPLDCENLSFQKHVIE
jgi:hypothetical protein